MSNLYVPGVDEYHEALTDHRPICPWCAHTAPCGRDYERR